MNNNRQSLIILSVLVTVGLVAAVFVLQQDPSSITNTTNNTTTNSTDSSRVNPESAPTSSPVGDISGITRATVAANNTLASCYVIFENKVYLIPSSWADEHPGGFDQIEMACGNDITQFFNQGQHSETARNMLNSLYLGELAD